MNDSLRAGVFVMCAAVIAADGQVTLTSTPRAEVNWSTDHEDRDLYAPVVVEQIRSAEAELDRGEGESLDELFPKK